jgi:hypothetical protein
VLWKVILIYLQELYHLQKADRPIGMALEVEHLNELCEACRNIFDTAERQLQDEDEEPAVEADFNSAAVWISNATVTNCCHLCTLLFHNADLPESNRHWNHLQESGKPLRVVIQKATFGSESTDLGKASDYVLVEVSGLGKARITLRRGMYMEDHCSSSALPDAAWVDEIAVKYEQSALSRNFTLQTADQITHWLENCSKSHIQCAHSVLTATAPSSIEGLPTRLLDVGVVNRSTGSLVDVESYSIEKMPYLRLRASNTLASDTKYLTLSHRWSKSPPLILNKQTLVPFHDLIPLSSTPSREVLTFKHAIQATRCLGFRYIWIDTLCINQDDDHEKLKEIAQMGQIYSRSILNLSATDSSSGSDGLFREINSLFFLPCRRRISSCNAKAKVFEELVAYTDSFPRQIDNGPLSSRGWVFQERVLAPRVVHFAADGVYWECASLRAAEGTPFLTSRFKNRFKKLHTIDFLDPASSQKFQEIWEGLVSAYSKTFLSFPQDKLVAMSAIARRMCQLRRLKENDYIAGLWRPNFHRQLLWEVSRAKESEKAVLTYLAPSWSWASITAKSVDWNRPSDGDPVAEIVSLDLSPKTSDPFGEIAAGSIRLRGPVCKAAVAFYRSSDDPSHEVWVSASDIDQTSLFNESWDVMPVDDAGTWKHGNPPGQVHLIWIQKTDGIDAPTMSGLMLKPVSGICGQYTRVGIFHKGRWNRPPNELEQLFRARILQPHEYLECDDSGTYTIEII